MNPQSGQKSASVWIFSRADRHRPAEAVAAGERPPARGQLGEAQLAHVEAVHPAQLALVEARRVALTRSSVKRSTSSSRREHRLVVAGAPAEQREVVAHRLRAGSPRRGAPARRRRRGAWRASCRRARAAAAGARRRQRRARRPTARAASSTSSCLGVLERWSSPRTTWVMPRVEVVDRDGEVVEHRAVGARDHRVVEVHVLEARCRPRITSWTIVAPSSGTRRRTAPSASGSPRKPRLGAVLALVGLDVLGGRARAVGVARRRAAPPAPPGGARRARSEGSGPRPSRARASAGRRGSARRSPASSARGRCPRCAARARPAAPRASSQLNSAVRAPPMCRAPVGDGAKRTLMSRCRHANRSPRLTRRRPAEAVERGSRAGRARDPDLQPVPAHVAPDRLRRGGLRRASARRMAASAIERRPDPRRLPAQLRLRGPRDRAPSRSRR